MEACELLTVELRLDRIEAELADELPPHLRSFARACVQRLPAPPAPDVLLRPATLATARAAVVHPVLADRGLSLLRLAVPAVLETDARVAAARAVAPTWAALSALTAARDAAARERFGRRAVDVLHRLHGSASERVESTAPAGSAAGMVGAAPAGSAVEIAESSAPNRSTAGFALPPVVAGWFEPDGVDVDDRALAELWEVLRARHGVAGDMRYERAAGVRPRAFVVEPGREVVVVIPDRIAAPAERFAVLHELGHAVAALALPAGVPRVVDEAAAAYVALSLECPDGRWYSPLAQAARSRRRALAIALDRIECSLPALSAGAPISERPPWALWNDPAAQAAYVAAERIADDLDRALGPTPAPGALAAALSSRRTEIDRLGNTTCAV